MSGGQISIMLTDFFQGMIMLVVFLPDIKKMRKSFDEEEKAIEQARLEELVKLEVEKLIAAEEGTNQTEATEETEETDKENVTEENVTVTEEAENGSAENKEQGE